MSKKNIRKVHIEDEIWNYYIQPQNGPNTEVIIFSPQKQRFSIKILDILNISSSEWWKTWFENLGNPYYEKDHSLSLTPQVIKDYIINKIINKNIEMELRNDN